MICRNDEHAPRLAFGDWQWCRACGSLRHPGGKWEHPDGIPLPWKEIADPALRTVTAHLTAEAERNAQAERVRRFAQVAVSSALTDGEKIDAIRHDFGHLLRRKRTPRTPENMGETIPIAAELVLFGTHNVDADEAAVALAALLKAAGLQVRLWAGRKGESVTLVVDAYDSDARGWIPIDPLGAEPR